MCPSRRRPPRLFDPKGDYRAEVTLYRCGGQFIIPAKFINKTNGLIKRNIAKLIREATKENIIKLESLGVRCLINDAPFDGLQKQVC